MVFMNTSISSKLANNIIVIVLYLIAATVMFNQSTYNISENIGLAQPTLILSNPSSYDITVQVSSTDGSATGEYRLL